MTTCGISAGNAWTCGTGNWVPPNPNIPKPGDPNSPGSLNATATFGGIDVSWSMPTVNPFAVAHTIVYRGLSSDFGAASQRTTVSGSHFYDKIIVEEPTEYFYWIIPVSVNGTYGDAIGPASATVLPMSTTIPGLIYGYVDDGVLAQSLKTKIDKITINGNDLLTEIQARIASGEYMGALIQQVQTDLSTTLTFFQEEIVQRTEANDALVQQINTMAAAIDNNMAALQNEMTVRANKDEILATQITTTQAELGDDITAGQVLLESKIDVVDGKVVQIGSLYTAKVQTNGLIGGFGIYNDGTFVDAGFDVDRFWIGRTLEDRRKPFEIVDGVTYIDTAVIRDLTVGTSKIADNAVTVPITAQANAMLVSTPSVDFGGGQVFLSLSAIGMSGFMDGQSPNIEGRLFRNGEFIGALPLTVSNYTNVVSASFATLDSPGEGECFYTLSLNAMSGWVDSPTVTIVAIGLKK